MARSAYLAYRAQQFNQNKIVVGFQECKDVRERKKFVEKIFQDSLAA